jgi:hypothetical protein
VDPQASPDQRLIAAAAKAGYVVNGRQLRRWRTEGLLPQRTVRGRGQGRGVEPSDPAHAAEQLIALCRWRERYARSADKLAVSLWYEGWSIRLSRVKAAAARSFRRMLDRGGQDDVLEVATHQSRLEVSGFSALERGLLPTLAARYEDPSGEQRASRELILDARTDAIAAALSSPGSYAVDEDLLTRYFQLDVADELENRPPGYSLRETTPRIVQALSIEEVISTIETSSDDELARVRTHLLMLAHAIRLIRTEDLSELPPLLPRWLEQLSTTRDTADPRYDPQQLTIGIGAVLTFQRHGIRP